MYKEVESDSDSSENDEYHAVSTIKANWLQDYESGKFGEDWPSVAKKVNEQKKTEISTELLKDVLKKVRSKQNTQQPPVSTVTQNAITTIIETNATATQQTNGAFLQNGISNGVPNGVVNDIAQATPTDSIHSNNIPRPYKPLVNPSGSFGFVPNMNLALPNIHVHNPINQSLPITNAASAYYQAPAHYGSHNSIPFPPNIGNIPGLPVPTQPQVYPQFAALQPQNVSIQPHLLTRPPNMNYPGHIIPQQVLPQQAMHQQNVHTPNMLSQQMPLQDVFHSNMRYQNVHRQNVPMPHGMQPMNTQRPSDPRLRRQMQPMQNKTRWDTPHEATQPPPPLPSSSKTQQQPPPSSSSSIPTQPSSSIPKAAAIAFRRRTISIADYRRYGQDPTERAKAQEVDRNDAVGERRPNQNGTNLSDVQKSNENSTARGRVQTNAFTPMNGQHNGENEHHRSSSPELAFSPEPTFSPTSETPASSPATELSNNSPAPDENHEEIENQENHENIENVIAEEVTVKAEQNEDYSSDASDATVEFTFETFQRDLKMRQAELDEDAATEVLGELSPQYIPEEGDESEKANEVEELDSEQANEVEKNVGINNEANAAKECEEKSDSDDLLEQMRVPAHSVEQMERCVVILEDIRDSALFKKYNKTRKVTKKRKRKTRRGRRCTRRLPEMESESESEQEMPELKPNSPNPVKEEVQEEAANEEVIEEAAREEAQEEVAAQQEQQEDTPPPPDVDPDALSEIVISSDENEEGDDENNNDNNNNNDDNFVYEISSDTDDE